jgi:hypothetical protein
MGSIALIDSSLILVLCAQTKELEGDHGVDRGARKRAKFHLLFWLYVLLPPWHWNTRTYLEIDS